MNVKIAFCGDNCEACPRYVATLTNNEEKLKEIALLKKKVGWSYDLENLEKMKCQGCQDIQKCEYAVKECCVEKKIENCGLCVDYPCERINKAFMITETNQEKFKNILTEQEYKVFQKAYFCKRENLDKINRKNQKFKGT